MTDFSGQTLEELEAAFVALKADPARLARLHAELLDRKSRRERSGKTEKSSAATLRNKVAASLAGVGATPRQSPRVQSTFLDQGADVPNSRRSERPRDDGRRQRTPPARPLGFSPTDEQLAALDAFATGENLKINAFAGSGKTSTLALLSQSTKGCGIYTAFNRACVIDSAQRFGANVNCSTLHALAFRSLRGGFRKDKLTGKLNPNLVTSHFMVPDFKFGDLKLSDKQMASLALATFRRFAQSRHDSIRAVRVPEYGVIGNITKEARAELTAAVHEIAEAIWSKMQSPQSTVPLGHDGYQKLWALQRPRLNVDFIMLDEAQDTNDVVLDLLERQATQIVYVGDRHQQIYEWRGAINALDNAQAEKECQLTQSFRFGDQIAALANAALFHLNETTKLRGNPRIASRLENVTHPTAVIARTNGTVLSAVISSLENGDIPYVEGGTKELKRLIGGVYELKQNGFSTVPDFFGFQSWDEVVEYSETEYGQELATFVALVQIYGPGTLWHVLKKVADDPALASFTISTTHKAKGREWDSVRLEDDFVSVETDEHGTPQKLLEEEIRILYVALTRAKRSLQVGEQSYRYLVGR